MANIVINKRSSQMQTEGFAVWTFSVEMRQSNSKNFLRRMSLSLLLLQFVEEIVQTLN